MTRISSRSKAMDCIARCDNQGALLLRKTEDKTTINFKRNLLLPLYISL